jgi:hypothetical protein
MRTRIILGLATAAAWGLAIAGIWLLPRQAVTVFTGGGVSGIVGITRPRRRGEDGSGDDGRRLLVRELVDVYLDEREPKRPVLRRLS